MKAQVRGAKTMMDTVHTLPTSIVSTYFHASMLFMKITESFLWVKIMKIFLIDFSSKEFNFAQ